MAKRKKESPEMPASEPPISSSEKVNADPISEETELDPATERSVELVSDPIPSEDDDGSDFEQRKSERVPLRIATVVQFRESEEETWKEVTQITTVSKTGAGLVLSRECPVGRLISLVMQMPAHLRLYDHFAPVYPMLGVVQNCYASTVEGQKVYHVGVAFIGKKVPSKAKADPRQCYRLKHQKEDGLWEVVEAAREFQPRKHSRFWRRFEVTVSVRDEKTRSIHRANVTTRDVSAGGMAVWGPLNVNIGDRVKVTSKDHDFYSKAVVRNRTEDQDETKSLVHFQFDGAEFPVSKISMRPETTDLRPAYAPAEPAEVQDHLPAGESDVELVKY